MYALHPSIPKSTLVTNPHIEEVDIAACILRKLRVVFPEGCVDLVGMWVEYRSAKILPLNDGGYFIGNGSPIEIVPDLLLDQPPFVLSFKFYNDDDTFAHAPYVFAEVEFLNAQGQVSTPGTPQLVIASLPAPSAGG
jgi:hypothetical protein